MGSNPILSAILPSNARPIAAGRFGSKAHLENPPPLVVPTVRLATFL
jgi:hypothetical protein